MMHAPTASRPGLLDWPFVVHSNRDGIYCLVDEEDYQWAIQWRWYAKASRGNRRFYLCRTKTRGHGEERRDRCLYLHVEIMKRTGILPPSEAHTMVDHRFGNAWDCRRKHLRWATPSMNRRNLFGREPYDLEELANEHVRITRKDDGPSVSGV